MGVCVDFVEVVFDCGEEMEIVVIYVFSDLFSDLFGLINFVREVVLRYVFGDDVVFGVVVYVFD